MGAEDVKYQQAETMTHPLHGNMKTFDFQFQTVTGTYLKYKQNLISNDLNLYNIPTENGRRTAETYFAQQKMLFRFSKFRMTRI